MISVNLSAQNYKADRLKNAVDVLGIAFSPDSLMPDTTISLLTNDGLVVSMRIDPMGIIEHIGIPLFDKSIRQIQPSPVYDFLEYAVLNQKYKINPNQLYLSKVIFKKGSWDILSSKSVIGCDCSIENRDGRLYIVTWKKDNKEIAVIGIPVDYELLNNDTRRNMEKTFVKELRNSHFSMNRAYADHVNDNDLCIYGMEGLFVKKGKSYLIELLNQNIYYKLITIYESIDSLDEESNRTYTSERVQAVVLNDIAFPNESFANLLMCDDNSIPDATMDIDFHLSNYQHENIEIQLSQLKGFCRQQGCDMYFASEGVQGNNIHAIMFASNLTKGYNHLFTMNVPTDTITSLNPRIKVDAYLFIPPIDKEKLLGTAPAKKTGVKFNLP